MSLPCPLPSLVQSSNKRIFLNPLRDLIKGCPLVPETQYVPIITPARSGSAFKSQVAFLESPSDSAMELMQLIGYDASADADVAARQSVKITQANRGSTRYMTVPIPCEHVFGTVENPLSLEDPFSEPIFMLPQSILKFEFFNFSTSAPMSFSFLGNARRISRQAMQRDQAVRDHVEEQTARSRKVYPAWITLDSTIDAEGATSAIPYPGVTILGSPANQTVAVQFQRNFNDHDVVATRIMITARGNTASDESNIPAGLDNRVRIQLYDAKTQQRVYNQAVDQQSFAGNAAFPYWLQNPIVVKQDTQLRAQITNLTGVNLDVSLTLQGIAVDM